MPQCPNVDDVVALEHAYGCGVAVDVPDAIIPIRTLRHISQNPNVGGEVLDASSIPHSTLEPPSAFFPLTWLSDENTPSWSTTNSFGRNPVDTKHLGQKQLAARWSINEASLVRWRSEGIARSS